MLSSGISRGQARSRPSTSHGHSSHLVSSFNPFTSSCRSPNPNAIGSGIPSLPNGAINVSTHVNPISLSACSSRSIDLRKRASSGEVNVDFDFGQSDAEGNVQMEQTEILPMLLDTPKLCFLPDMSSDEVGKSRGKRRSSETKEYIAACSSAGIGEIKAEVTLPEVSGQPTDAAFSREIPILDESKCNGSSRPLPDPLSPEQSKLDRYEFNPNRSRPSSSREIVPVQQQKNKKNSGVILSPLRKPHESRMSITSSEEEEEEERKESGDTDSECESSSGIKRNMCSANRPRSALEGNGGQRGLKNLGNTCYMNSTLQCLSNIPSFREFFLHKEHIGQINTSRGAAKGELAKAFGALLAELWKSGERERNSSVKPVKVKQIVGKVASRFSGYQQHDAQEFLLFFLDALHDDLNRVSRAVPFEELKDIPGESPLAKSQRCWDNYIERNDSHVVDTFCGQLHSEIICQECGKRSDVFEPFMDLSTPIPEASGSEMVSVQDCLDAYTKTEVLSGLEAVYCSQCKDHCDSMKTIRVHRLPEVLVIHLKRFSSHRKLAKAVDIPIDSLDMRPYLSESSPHGGEVLQTPTKACQDRETYKLVGAVNHMGSFHGGHYTADCLHSPSQEWLKLNDSIVTSIQPDQINNEDAYLLLYQRVEPLKGKEQERSHL